MFGWGKPKRREIKPHFRFYPNAYANGGPLEESNAVCDVCGEPCVWRYTGGIHAPKRLENCCAGCIAAGNLRKTLGKGFFGLADISIEDETASDALQEELLACSPGVACFNPFIWPCLDGVPMAFIAAGDDPAFTSDSAAIEATRVAFADIEWEDNDAGSSPYALIFREVGGERLRAVIDLD